MGSLDAVSHEFALEHSDRLWKQLVLPGGGLGPSRDGGDGHGGPDAGRSEFSVVVGLASAAAVTAMVMVRLIDDEQLGFRLASFAALPFLFAYFAWKRRLDRRTVTLAAAAFAVGAAVAALYPFEGPDWHTSALSALHLPIALWFAVGVAYAGGRWRDGARRMDFIRFTGETFIYYTLIALGGGVLMGLTAVVFADGIGVEVDSVIGTVVLPGGAAGAVLVAAWLVESRQGVIEAMAPVLTRVFSPLFALMFLVFLFTMAATGQGLDVEREVLIIFDLLLVVVLGLVLYSISARDPEAGPGWFDRVLLVLVVSALAIDLLGLAAILGRISEFGFSANKTAALGENLVLLVNLAVTAWLTLGFVRGRNHFRILERWQTDYLIVYPIWATLVVLVFPVVFGFA